jgi:hypothetical protein
MTSESFEEMLTGGHPNSLGRTIEVVDIVLANSTRLSDLYNCYSVTMKLFDFAHLMPSREYP